MIGIYSTYGLSQITLCISLVQVSPFANVVVTLVMWNLWWRILRIKDRHYILTSHFPKSQLRALFIVCFVYYAVLLYHPNRLASFPCRPGNEATPTLHYLYRTLTDMQGAHTIALHFEALWQVRSWKNYKGNEGQHVTSHSGQHVTSHSGQHVTSHSGQHVASYAIMHLSCKRVSSHLAKFHVCWVSSLGFG